MSIHIGPLFLQTKIFSGAVLAIDPWSTVQTFPWIS